MLIMTHQPSLSSQQFESVYRECSLFWKNYHQACLWLRNQGFNPINPFIHQPMYNEDINFYRQTDHQVNLIEQLCESVNKETEVNFDVNSGNYTDQEESCDEVDDDYVRFIMETRRHQKEREKFKAEKARMEAMEEIVYKDISEIEQQRLNKISPILVNGREKDEAYKLLYGSQWSTIRPKESLIQTNFNIFCDTNKPSFWPTIPIKIK